MTTSRTPPVIAFLPFPGMEDYLVDELHNRFHYNGEIEHMGPLLCLPQPIGNPYWASTAMLQPQIAHFSSIKEAASILRAIQRNWAACPAALFRRTALIQDALPHINIKPRPFTTTVPTTPMGLFTLLDEHTMIYSAQTTSPLPCGRLTFVEDHVNPPSRAYLKLQEALTMASVLLAAPLPSPGSRCLDAGASPGGWTWVLAGLGCDVLAIDRAPLAPDLMQNPHVTFRVHDAFTIPPEEIGECDWVLSDVACYPDRLLPWVRSWIDSELTKNMVCTIKLKGPGAIDYALVGQFSSLPGGRVIHLNANKHELTLLYKGE